MTVHLILPQPSASMPQPEPITRFVDAATARFLAVVDAQPDCQRLRNILGLDA